MPLHGPQLHPHIGPRNRIYVKAFPIPTKEKNCKECGELFLPEHPANDYCDYKCRKSHRRKLAREYHKAHKEHENKISKEYQRKKRREHQKYWVCPNCEKRIKLDFSPLKAWKKLDAIICSCGYKNCIV